METGTLEDLDVKPGDVVTFRGDGYFTVMQDKCLKSHQSGERVEYRDSWNTVRAFRIVSRASDTPRLWREMTDAEKGALLLAHHDGKVIENCQKGDEEWFTSEPCWSGNFAYRVKPEPVQETFGINWKKYGWNTTDTHRITFDLIDGEPDCDSIKMEELY